MCKLSIVIPTFNRGVRLATTVKHLVACDRSNVGEIELLLVDDGSAPPASLSLRELATGDGFRFRSIQQENAGPAAARNRGFRESNGEIVLFVDDDILCPGALPWHHVEAHEANPGCVIVGRCPFAEPDNASPLIEYIHTLGNDAGRVAMQPFVQIPIIASGQISFERSMFETAEGVYRDDLSTPAAEEYELSLRLLDRGIPILLATEISALHDHPVELRSMCRQAFKHGMGAAEAAIKCPRTMELPELRTIIHHNGYLREKGDSSAVMQDAFKRLLATSPFRQGLLVAGLGCERLFPSVRLLYPLYRTLLGAHFRHGIQAGFKRFSTEGEASRGEESKRLVSVRT